VMSATLPSSRPATDGTPMRFAANAIAGVERARLFYQAPAESAENW
jgi:hypothetical protein